MGAVKSNIALKGQACGSVRVENVLRARLYTLKHHTFPDATNFQPGHFI
jgi:hypothetical protein